jgi:uncharacterized protein (DUF885 family)
VLHETLDRFFETFFRLSPVTATFAGVHEHDDRLPDWSPDGLEAAVADMRRLRHELSADRSAVSPFDATAESGPAATFARTAANIDRQLADAGLEIQAAEIEGRHFHRANPALFTGEAVFGIVSLITRHFAPPDDRLRCVTARLEAIPSFFDQARRSLAPGAAPAAWVARAVRECEAARVLLSSGLDLWLAHEASQAAVDASGPGFDPFRAARAAAVMCTCRATPEVQAARAAARVAISAFTAFAESLKAATPAPDSRYACGGDFFDLLLSRGHCTRQSRVSLLSEARGLFEEQAARLAAAAHREAPGGWPEIQERLAADHPSVESYLPSHDDLWHACREVALANDLVTWPDRPIRFVPIPVWTREAAPFLYYLFYRCPAPFDPPAIHHCTVTPIDTMMPPGEIQQRLRAANTSVIKLNHVVHHAAIGHHVQNAHALRSASRIGRVAAVDGASRIAMFCGGTLAEGWACYATDLMAEHGFLSPLELVAEEHSRLRQLARAVVDIELHQGSLRFDEAVAFYMERVGMAPAAARNEACKNSMFPGAAVMYWLGTDGLHRLRADQQRALGPAFSLRAFHDRLLSFGAIPVPLIATIMTQAGRPPRRPL